MQSPITVLCIIDRRRNALSRAIRHAGYNVIDSFTLDQAVAIAVSHRVDIAVLDRDLLVETGGWSVAQSLKLVRPAICVLLVTRARRISPALPKGVDVMVSQCQPAAVLDKIAELVA